MGAITHLRTGAAALLLLGSFAVSPGYADECPDAKSAGQGFVAELRSSKTEVSHSGSTDVRTVLRSGGSALVELTLFQGLFELDRLDRGKRATFRPISDLAKTYPLAPGKKVTAVFEETRDQEKRLRTYVLETRKQTDTLTFGACKYKVFLIDRSVLDDKSKPIFLHTDYYAPDLKFVVGKEYRESNGGKTLNKFEKIYPLPPR